MSEEQQQGSAATVWLDEPVDQESRPVPHNETEKEEASSIAEGMQTIDRVNGLIGALETTSIAPAKAVVLRSILKNVRESIDNAIELLGVQAGAPPSPDVQATLQAGKTAEAQPAPAQEAQRIVEGVFNGESMVGDDGKEYTVPPNYASKSKLVEGDLMKLQIGDRGNFMYKQIGPIERQRIIGSLSFDQESGQYTVLASGRSWKVLKASVTYFKAEVADEAVILVPKNAPSKWAAVENVIKRNPSKDKDRHE